MASWADVFTLIDRIRKEYPSAAYLLDNPEVGPLLLKAVSGEYDQQTFQQKLYATNYWKTTGDSQRKWDAQAALDPGTAKQLLAQIKAKMSDLASSLGRGLTPQGLHWLGVTALRDDWDENQLTDAILNQVKWQDYGMGSGAQSGAQTKAIGGQVGTTIDQLRALNAQYMTQGSDRGNFDTALRILKGEQTLEGVESAMRQKAMERWPHLAQVIKDGGTPAGYFDPYRQMIAENLEINADSVDLIRDTEWSQVISYADPSGEIRPMTLSEAEKMVRSSDRWRQTKGAGEQVSSFAESFTRMMGKTA